MKTTLLIAFFVVGASPQEKETAEQFLKKVEEKYTKAKSLKWKSAGKAEGLGEVQYEFQVKGAKFNVAATMTDTRHGGEQKKALICDGTNVVGEAGTTKAAEGAAKDLVSKVLKLGPFITLMMAIESADEDVKAADLEFGGEEKIGGRLTRLLTSTITIAGGREVVKVTRWFDAETLALVKVKTSAEGEMELEETITGFAFDAEIADAVFAAPKADAGEELAIGRTRMALEYFAMWNGAFPASLEELVRQPASAKAWPEGGYLSEVPKLEYDGKKLAGRELTKYSEPAPEPKVLTTRYRLAQARLAVAKGAAVAMRMPASLKEAGAPLKDGWGVEFEYKAGDGVAKISSNGGVPTAPLGDAQKKKVAELAAQLAGESLEDREKAERELGALGEGVLPLLKEQADKATDKDAKARLQGIADRLKASLESLADAFVVHACLVKGAGAGVRASNERNGSASLKTVCTAEADFRSNDRDDNRTNDFWVGDLRSLYYHKTLGQEIMLIEPTVADADACALSGGLPKPKAGYLFRAVKHYREGGAVKRYGVDEAKSRNGGKFGFVAYPAEYGVTGRSTFLVGEENTIWRKDTMGEPVTVMPENPGKEGWVKMD